MKKLSKGEKAFKRYCRELVTKGPECRGCNKRLTKPRRKFYWYCSTKCKQRFEMFCNSTR